MPDYSGYAQRQHQDPNLAAWANISGNLANIFGLDPAKAAEARRGQQQEDYNELRNQAQIRQQLANERIGQLLSGKGFDPARGEFTNAADYADFVRAMVDLGDARQAVQFGPGRWQQQQQARIDAENRSFDYKAEVQAKRDEKEAVKKAEALKKEEAAKSASKNEGLAKKWKSVDIYGNSKIGVSPDAGIARFNRLIIEGDAARSIAPFNQALGYSRVTEATKGLPTEKQLRESNPEFSNWLSKFAARSLPVEIENRLRSSGANLEDEKKAVAAALIRQFRGQLSQDDVEDIADRIVKSELTLTHEQNKGKSDPMARVTGKDQLEKFLIDQAKLPPENRSETVLLRIKVPGSLNNDYSYEEYNVADLLDPRNQNNPNHPFFK